jgi:hypothetical protein
MQDSLAIREAFATGEFAAGEKLWREYMDRLEAEIRAGRASVQALAEAGELLEWCRLGAKANCARALGALNQAHVAHVYRTESVESVRCGRTSV